MMIPMENEHNNNQDNDNILVDIPIETFGTDSNIGIIDDKKLKHHTKKPFSDELMARYLQDMWDVIDQDELPVYYPSEGTAPRSTFRFYKNDIREEQEEVITYVDADDLGFLIPSEGTIPRSSYVKSSEIDESYCEEDDELDDYHDSAILSSPLRNETMAIMIKPIQTQPKELELKDRASNSQS